MISIVQINAETIYKVDEYSYTIINNESVSLYAWDYSSDVLVVPDSFINRYVVSVSNRAFKNDENLTAIDFSAAEHLTTIGIETFYNSGLSSKVTLTPSITTIGERAFENCQYLPEVDIQSNINAVPAQCFNRCLSLSKVTLPDELTSIEGFAFANCPILEYMEIPSGVSYISPVAFQNDENIVLGVYSDTAAHQYAAENQIDHKILDRQLGDVNFDGAVDVFDATEIQKFAAEKVEFFNEQYDLADINNDGYVDVMDALLVQKATVGKYEIPETIIRY